MLNLHNLTYSFDDYVFHKSIIYLLKKETSANILLYGPVGSGKKTLTQSYINFLYSEPLHLKKKMHTIDIKLGGTVVTTEYITSGYHYEIFLDEARFYDRVLMYELLHYITNYKPIDNRVRTVVFYDVDKLSNDAQLSLRKMIEEHYRTVRFIFISNNISRVEKALQSRCLNIRVPAITYDECFTFSKHHYPTISDEILYDTIDSCSGHMASMHVLLQAIVENRPIPEFSSPNTYSLKLVECIEKMHKEKDLRIMKEIREIGYEIVLLHHSLIDVCRQVIQHYIQSDKLISETNKVDFIQWASDLMHRLSKVDHLIVGIEFIAIKRASYL